MGATAAGEMVSSYGSTFTRKGAHARLGSSGGANGNGATPDEAANDLRQAVEMVFDEDGIPRRPRFMGSDVEAEFHGLTIKRQAPR
jgi:hypothetical protein